MRRRISLYIAGKRVDLGDQEVILFNYTMSDLTDPAVVKNSYSQQITLDGTPNNNAIFGDMWRSDRVTMYGSSASGINFNPSVKTPFVIFNELNEVLESGYVKLDEVVDRGFKTQYKVSLFGGLGAFFYALSYTPDGDKRTLADLKYTGETAGENELDFVMNAASVKAAWAGIEGAGQWGILNFAPTYNGIPAGLFDANKAIFRPSPGMIADGYYTKSGFSICTLPNQYTEWETFDLRSYLQRPVIRMKAILEAIAQPYNNGGYHVYWDEDINDNDNPYWSRTWLTLPLLQQLTLDIQTTDVDLNLVKGVNDIPGGGASSTNYDINISVIPSVQVTGSTGNVYLHCNMDTQGEENHYLNWVEIVVTAFDADGYQVAQRVVTASTESDPDRQMMDYVGEFDSAGNWRSEPINIGINGQGIAKVSISASMRGISWGTSPVDPNPNLVWNDPGLYSSNKAADENIMIDAAHGTYTTSKEARSGSTITKKMLLSTEKTPADYLLSYCKMFGFIFQLDKATKTITIVKRNHFYQDDTIDLTRRIVQGTEVKYPFVYDSKWYDFRLKYNNGQYAQYYQNIKQKTFGVSRVNTGYDFNADVKDVMESVLFNGAVNYWDVSKYYVVIDKNGVKYPSIFQDGGKYTLYRDEESVDFDLPIPSINGGYHYTWLNQRKGYDAWEKVQFFNEDKKGYVERDTLLFYTNSVGGGKYSITDDNGIMMNMNNNTPCWILNARDFNDAAKVTYMPRFSRYIYEDTDLVQNSLDFGNPEELPLPGDVEFLENADIFSFAWKNYITDLYDDDTKILRCKVNLGGMQVNESLFGKFYWYDNSLWVLNRIINHSITTWDDTECEFIMVQDKTNYTDNVTPPTPPDPPTPTDAYLYSDTTSIALEYDEGLKSINVFSNVSWTVESAQSWITFNYPGGTGDRIIRISFTENTSSSSRSGVVTLRSTDGSGLVFNIPVNQAAEEPVPGTLSVLPLSIDCDLRGWSGTLVIKTPGAWTVESPNLIQGTIDDQHWIEIARLSGTGDAGVNTWVWGRPYAPTPGTSSIIVRSGTNSVTIPVNKHDVEGSIAVDINGSKTFVAPQQGYEVEFNVTATGAWTIEEIGELGWVVNPDNPSSPYTWAGTGNAVCRVVISSMPQGEDARQVQLSAKLTGTDKSDILEIRQINQ